MKFKYLLVPALFGLALGSCHKDDDSSEYSDTDPRIRSVYIEGVNVPFIVNDCEHVIYNYDSLTYGTDVSHMMIFFSDYDVKDNGLTYFVDEGDGWKYYTNRNADSVYLDLRNLKVATISLDQKNTTHYRLDIRVHKYDINSFDWAKLSTLSFKGEVDSYKVVEISGKYYYFYTNKSGDSYALSSADGKKWASKKLAKNSYDWASLTVFNDKAVAFVDGKIATIDVANAYAVSLNDNEAGLKALLFSLGDKCWALGADGLYAAENGTDFQKSIDMPAGFPTDDITTLVTLTGARTRIGYIYGSADGEASIWALDKGGNLIKTASSSTTGLPVLSKTTMVHVDNEIGLVGGVNTSNKYVNTFYSSSDAGITWSENWHKELPSSIGRTANLGAFVTEEGKLLFVSGETAKGISSAVWTGTLKGSSK